MIAQVVGEDFIEAANERETIGTLGTLYGLAVDFESNFARR